MRLRWNYENILDMLCMAILLNPVFVLNLYHFWYSKYSRSSFLVAHQVQRLSY